MTLSGDRVQELVGRFAGLRTLVIGDLMLDRYIYGAVRRISPEAPVPVVKVTGEKCMPGGASNVAWNIRTLGAAVEVAGVVGADAEADTLKTLLEQAGVGVGRIRVEPSFRTTVKTRIIAERQQVVRVDWEDEQAGWHIDMGAFIDRVEQSAEEVDSIIIEDYGKGAVQQPVVDAVIRCARDRGIPVGYDPKDGHALDVRGVSVATPNRKEAYSAMGVREPIEERSPLEDTELMALGQSLLTRWEAEMLAITLGPQGMALFEQDAAPAHIPTRAREVFDVSGAGDTVIAVATLALAAGASHREAAELANHAAGVVVGKLGTAPCTASELVGSVG